ncbi:MAG: type II toxin-antitoxin system VapC family toxin [Bacteroidia bacterium]|nr:type II toxin-antitoxin system VapC family toxin [Bacteroidia bacterium]
MIYLLDTNICIYLIKRKPIEVFERFKSIQLGSIGISSITLAELQFGIRKSSQVEKNKLALDQFLVPLEIFDFDFSSANEYGLIRADLASKGTQIGPLDMLIAAHAISLDAILVTNNDREFNRVENLIVENWVEG